MALMNIRQFGDQVLKQKSLPVEKLDNEISGLVKNMAESMYDAHGLGLAAPQLGILRRVIVLDITNEGEDLRSYINPEIIKTSEETAEEEEGCLSFGTVRMQIVRPKEITLEAIDFSTKEKVVLEADDWLARVIQHEVDHLNGVTILEKASKNERKKALKELHLLATVPRL